MGSAREGQACGRPDVEAWLAALTVRATGRRQPRNRTSHRRP